MSESLKSYVSHSGGIYTGKFREFFPLDKAVFEAQLGLSYLVRQREQRLILTSYQHGAQPVLSLTNKFLNVAQLGLCDVQNGVSPNDLSEPKKLSIAVIQQFFSILDGQLRSDREPEFAWFKHLRQQYPDARWAFNSIKSKEIWNDLPDSPAYDLPHLNSETKLIEAYKLVLKSGTPKP